MALKIQFNSKQLIFLSLPLLILIICLWAARVNYSVQIKSLNYFLKQNDLTQDNVALTRLTLRYIKQKQLYRGEVSHDEFSKEEFFYNQSILPRPDEIEQPDLSFEERIIAALIDQFRKFINKSSMNSNPDNSYLKILYFAFYYEKTKDYQKAIQLYDKLFPYPSAENIQGILLLHKAYCLALTENFDTAEKIYLEIIRRFKGTASSVTATSLLNFMKEFNREKDFVIRQHSLDIIKSGKLIDLMNYKQALKILNSIQSVRANEKALLDYYKGVCLEESGFKIKAIESFMSSIRDDLKSNSAILANRRIFNIAINGEKNGILLPFVRMVGNAQKDQVLKDMDLFYLKYPNTIPSGLLQETNLIAQNTDIIESNIRAMMPLINTNSLK